MPAIGTLLREEKEDKKQNKQTPAVFSSLLVFFPVVKENSPLRAREKKRWPILLHPQDLFQTFWSNL